MFRVQTKPEVRILDTPLKMLIADTFIVVPLNEDKVMIITGKFKQIRDEDAYALARKQLNKVA